MYMRDMDSNVHSNEKTSEFGLKLYSAQDIIFCIARILFGVIFTYVHDLYIPLFLLALLLMCKFVALSYIIVSNRLLSRSKYDLYNSEIIITKISLINKRAAFYTVVLPYIIQFILCFYVASLFCVYASKYEYTVTMWIIGVLISVLNMILTISTLDIFAKEGYTVPLTQSTLFNVEKNRGEEVLIIIFWTVIYLICSVYFGYMSIIPIVTDQFDMLSLSGLAVFISSVIQTIKCINLPDIYKHTFRNIKFYDYIIYETTLMRCRKDYLKRQTLKIVALSISTLTFILGVSFVGVILNNKIAYAPEFLSLFICLVSISFTASIFIIRRMCEVPLMKGFFEEYDDEEDDDKKNLLHDVRCV